MGVLTGVRNIQTYGRLRVESDHLLRESGARTKIFLANLGPLAAIAARASWAKNLFEAGGIEADGNEGFPGKADVGKAELVALVASLPAARAKLVRPLLSADVYAEEAEAAPSARANARS